MAVVGDVGAHTVNLCVGPISVACSAASSVLGGAAQTAETGLLNVVANAVGDAATTVVSAMVSALNATTSVDFNASWFSAQTKVMAFIALPFVTVFFLLQIIGSVLRREPGGLARAVVGLGKALVVAAAAIPIMQLVLAASDQMCDLLIGATGNGIAGLAQEMFAASLANPTGGPVLGAILGCWAIAAAFLLWAVLLFRKTLLLVTGAFTMLAFAGASWDVTRGWVRKWTETVAALVFSKLVIVVILITGINAMGLTGGSGESSWCDLVRRFRWASAGHHRHLVALAVLEVRALVGDRTRPRHAPHDGPLPASSRRQKGRPGRKNGRRRRRRRPARCRGRSRHHWPPPVVGRQQRGAPAAVEPTRRWQQQRAVHAPATGIAQRRSQRRPHHKPGIDWR